MKRTLITAVALAACVGTQMFAQNVKEGVITFALTEQHQKSISTNPNVNNAGKWSQIPQYYKTGSVAINTKTILQCIGFVLHDNANYYTTQGTKTVPAAQLVLVQGELGGFFNITPELADAQTDLSLGIANLGFADLTDFDSTLEAVYARLATGRHFRPVPAGFDTEGAWPPGHHQPWGQIFVKDLKQGVCDNVTPFFAITVQECYDCFYLSSFITDTKFKFKAGRLIQDGPPCCGSQTPSDLSGCGKDKYYMAVSFDNTYNNPYLNDENPAWIGVDDPANVYAGVVGLGKDELVADGITPDFLPYVDPILSQLGKPSPYQLRFTLNGIMTYNWCLKFINSNDLARDFVGTANYAANGYSFYQLLCGYLTGSMSIAEKIAKAEKCCANLPWYDSWYGVGWNNQQHPWADFFGSPINVPASLALHIGVNEFYEPRWQWPQGTPEDIPALPDSLIDTQDDPLDGGTDTHVPMTRWYGLNGSVE